MEGGRPGGGGAEGVQGGPLDRLLSGPTGQADRSTDHYWLPPPPQDKSLPTNNSVEKIKTSPSISLPLIVFLLLPFFSLFPSFSPYSLSLSSLLSRPISLPSLSLSLFSLSITSFSLSLPF